MSVTTSAVQFDMYDRNTYADPYPVYRRLRDEAPLYYNEEYDFYAVRRFEDAERVMVDREGFISSKGIVYNIMPYIVRGKERFPTVCSSAKTRPCIRHTAAWCHACSPRSGWE